MYMTREEVKEYQKQYYQEKLKQKRQCEEYRDRNKKYQEDYRRRDIYRGAIKKYQQSQKYRDAQRTYQKDRRANDPTFKLICNIRTRHNGVLKGKQSTTKGLGCSRDFLKEHLEKQFTEGMSWDSYGSKEGQWSIDHIKPLDLLHTNPELLSELIHYTNLQPMWHIENLKKGKSC